MFFHKTTSYFLKKITQTEILVSCFASNRNSNPHPRPNAVRGIECLVPQRMNKTTENRHALKVGFVHLKPVDQTSDRMSGLVCCWYIPNGFEDIVFYTGTIF
jgi:hypothetical protein